MGIVFSKQCEEDEEQDIVEVAKKEQAAFGYSLQEFTPDDDETRPKL